MRLSSILEGIVVKKIYGDTGIEISDISIDSRTVKNSFLFVAIEGFKLDGHQFARDAVKKGAVAVISERKLDLPPGIIQIIVKDTRAVLPQVSANFFCNPSRSLKIIGITGTNGKTTTCYLINSILKDAGFKTSIISTFMQALRLPSSVHLNHILMRGKYIWTGQHLNRLTCKDFFRRA